MLQFWPGARTTCTRLRHESSSPVGERCFTLCCISRRSAMPAFPPRKGSWCIWSIIALKQDISFSFLVSDSFPEAVLFSRWLEASSCTDSLVQEKRSDWPLDIPSRDIRGTISKHFRTRRTRFLCSYIFYSIQSGVRNLQSHEILHFDYVCTMMSTGIKLKRVTWPKGTTPFLQREMPAASTTTTTQESDRDDGVKRCRFPIVSSHMCR